MQPVKQRPQQLLAVLLPISSKLGTPLGNLGLKLARGDIADVALQSSKEGGVRGRCSKGNAVWGSQFSRFACMHRSWRPLNTSEVHIGPSAVLE